MSYSEHCRFEYPDIKPEDRVLDIGGYEGNFADEIHRRYGCRVEVFEPIFFEQARRKLRQHTPMVTVFPFAVRSRAGMYAIFLKENSTGFYADSCASRDVACVSIGEILKRDFALAKINAEGSEYEILDAVLDLDLAAKARHWQVQFHDCVPDCITRRKRIFDGLSRTHELINSAPGEWENWQLKP